MDLFINMHRIIGNRFPNHRIFVAIAFLLPAMMGNILLWKSDRENKSALLAGLYMVCRRSMITPCFGYIQAHQRNRVNIQY